MAFRYSLEKYSGSGSRYICPQCGQKEFVRYVDTKTGIPVGSDIGRCNREEKCGYHLPPRKSQGGFNPSSIFKPGIREKNKTSFISRDLLMSTMKAFDQNSFTKGLVQIFGQDMTTQLVERFFIGTESYNAVFWQVDQHMRIRTGKIMNYDPLTLKRQGKPYWAHTHFKLTDFNLEQCLFGLHQVIDLDPGTPVCIAEAEKTAIFMSGYFPKVIWMAAGALQHLSKTKLLPLLDYEVYLYPDIGAERIWAEKTRGFSNVKIINWCGALSINPKEYPGADLADFPEQINSFPMPQRNNNH